jgi:hypothetical protein
MFEGFVRNFGCLMGDFAMFAPDEAFDRVKSIFGVHHRLTLGDLTD